MRVTINVYGPDIQIIFPDGVKTLYDTNFRWNRNLLTYYSSKLEGIDQNRIDTAFKSIRQILASGKEFKYSFEIDI